MAERALTVDEVLALLAATPTRIAEITAGVSAQQLRDAPANGEWSAVEVLAHMRSCADVWGDCMATIIREDEPTIRAVNPRTWIRSTDYVDQEYRASLRAFAKQRAALLALLEPLPPKAWSRKATVVGAGKQLERTVFFYARWLANHERPHIKQIQSVVTATAP